MVVRVDVRVVDEGVGILYVNFVCGGYIVGVCGDGIDVGECGDGEWDGVGKFDVRVGAVRRVDGTSVDVRV